MERINNWEYGQKMLEQNDIESLDEWSDDKEMAYSIMDRKFDYLWSEDCGRIHFINRLYACGYSDELKENRGKEGALELWFDNYDEVFLWIIARSTESDKWWKWWYWMKKRIGM